jgi:predicted nucleotidyltransferase
MDAYLETAQRVAQAMAAWPEVDAVALGGSRASGLSDDASDVDLYVYGASPPSLERRRGLVAGSPRFELDNRFFETGDEWLDPRTTIHVDVMYRTPGWIEADLERVLTRHEAWVGYSTCFWDNLRTARPLFDRRGWYAGLRARAAAPYPEALRRAIVARNRPLLAANVSSFAAQLEKAVARGDPVSANHRAAAFLASYFDVLFALNRAPHPGEKRLLEHVARRCPNRPGDLEAAVRRLLGGAARADGAAGPAARALAADLDLLLKAEGLLDRA